MYFADKSLICKDCQQNFLFTAGEQDFYASKGLLNEPGRCPDCRNRRKAQAVILCLPSVTAPGAIPPKPLDVTPVVCADCGVETTVPFRPRQDRPVYCRECLTKHRALEAIQAAQANLASNAEALVQ
jgi:CxxC-x17-CxxC domain-containing protein